MDESGVLWQETYVDELGYARHTNCTGILCRVQNCRQSILAGRNWDSSLPVSLPSDFVVQKQRVRNG